MKRMRIEQIDVWTFGDGRPFEAGEDHHRVSMFPPTGMTMQGAIRAKILADSGVSFQKYRDHHSSCAAVAKIIGWPDEPGFGLLSLRGPWLTQKDVLLYPVPADMVTVGEAVYTLRPDKNRLFKNNAPGELYPLWLKNMEPARDISGWLKQIEFEKYLRGETDVEITPSYYLFNRESRFSVKIDSKSKRPQEGHLFALEYVRLADGVALVLDVEGVNLPERGLLALGGDARVARYQIDNGEARSQLEQVQALRFKIVFITPAYFDQGWQPNNWHQWFPDAHLVTVALKRPILIGGRDIANNKPKALRRFVPAGSVYFFECKQNTIYTGQPVTEFGAEIGFGQIMIGGWDYV